jgi:glycosyltransferase involved in cell wall biosynthesis
MKKILLISKEWSPKRATGLGFASSTHETIFKELGFVVTTVSSNDSSKDINFQLKNLLSFILNPFYFLQKAEFIIKESKPDLIIVESFQTVISEIFLYVSKNNSIKTAVISHGVSIFPYNKKIKYYFRFFLWLIYLPILSYLIKKCDIFFSLDLNSKDNRHLDTLLFKRENKTLIKYNNFSRFENYKKTIFESKNKKKVLCLGYINHIKNQIDLIEIANETSDLDIEIKIVFNDYNKNYLNTLRQKIDIAGVKNISIINESETDIYREISESWLLINTSITEVSPLSLIEGNSLSKMFLSYDVGSLDKFKGSIINKNKNQIIFNMRSLYNNSFFINKFESIGLEDYKKNYSIDALKESFNKIRYLF